MECKEVKTGQIIGNYIEITDGLSGNEQIIKTITSIIEDGSKVAVAKAVAN